MIDEWTRSPEKGFGSPFLFPMAGKKYLWLSILEIAAPKSKGHKAFLKDQKNILTYLDNKAFVTST